MIHVTVSQLDTVRAVIRSHAPTCHVYAFGSRHKGNHKEYSDLDLAFAAIDGKRLGIKRTGIMKEAFEESDLPFCVDVVDYNGVSEAFREIIDGGCERIE